MDCPLCNGPMYDNRTTKRNPKQPDYKCKDPSCNKAVWLPKEKPQQKFEEPQKPQMPQTANLRAMVLSYAKDVVIAELNKDRVTGSPVAQIRAYFTELWDILGS